MKDTRYQYNVIQVLESLNNLLYMKDDLGNYVIKGSESDGDDGGDFLMLKSLLDKICQSLEFMKKLKFALLYVKIKKFMDLIPDSEFWDKITNDVVGVKDVSKLRCILSSLDKYIDLFDVSTGIMSFDTIKCIRNVFMSIKLLKLRNKLDNYTLWKNFVINIVSDDTRCNFEDSMTGLGLIASLSEINDRSVLDSISSVSSVKSAISILESNNIEYDKITEFTELIFNLYDGSINLKELRNIIQFTQVDIDHNRSIQFSKINDLLNRLTSEDCPYLTYDTKFFISEFIQMIIYDSYKMMSDAYFKLNSYANSKYIKIRNMFDEYLERKDPDHMNEEFIIDNTYNKSDVLIQGRIKLIPINSGNLIDIKNKFGMYIDDKLYFDPIDAQKISYKVLREITNISDVYYNRKTRSEKIQLRNELIKNLQLK